uniref:Uncharacterized protein n=1 Tax=Opuntia streptacantha TaxID=393608 RepID=A0A7C9AY94_OPUST
MAIKVVAITTMHRIFSISFIFELNKCIAWRPWWDLQINVNNWAILIKEILHFSLTDVTWKVANIDGAINTSSHVPGAFFEIGDFRSLWKGRERAREREREGSKKETDDSLRAFTC